MCIQVATDAFELVEQMYDVITGLLRKNIIKEIFKVNIMPRSDMFTSNY